MDLFTPKAPPLFGLDISSSSVKMLEIVEAGKGGYRVDRYAIEPLPRDAVVDGSVNNLEAVAESVNRAYKRLGTRTKHVAMAVPTGAVITKKIIVPAGLRDDEMAVQVEAEANQYIPFALDEVNLDFQTVGVSAGQPGRGRGPDRRHAQGEGRGSRRDRRVCRPQGPGDGRRVLRPAERARDRDRSACRAAGGIMNIAVVDIGQSLMNVTVLRNDQSVYTREQSFGGGQLTQDIVNRYGMSPEEAENAKRSGGLPDDFESEVLRPFMENLVHGGAARTAVLLHLDPVQHR